MPKLRAAGLSLLVMLIGMAEISFGPDPGHRLRNPPMTLVSVLFIGATALLFRHKYPRAVAVVTAVCGAIAPFFPPHQIVVDIAPIVALYTLALTTDRRTAALLGVFAAGLLTASSIVWQPEHLYAIGNILPVNYVAAAVAVGDAVRNQQALLDQERRRALEAERSRESEARRQVREERVRIARDLHDVVAHHITLVNAQAGVAHHLMRTDPDRAYQALAGIRDTSRNALDELRATVGLLRADDEPESRQPVPAFADLDTLLGSFRATGLHIYVTRNGREQPLTGSADLAAYRILQEALTNTSKHATTPYAAVTLTYTTETLALTVANPATPGHRGTGTGHGLIGMRERAESAGGHFTTTTTDRAFTITATLPVSTQRRPE